MVVDIHFRGPNIRTALFAKEDHNTSNPVGFKR